MTDQPGWPSSDEGTTPPPPPPPPPTGGFTPPAPAPGAYAGQTQAATYGVRLGARFIDALILLIPGFIISLVIGGGASSVMSASFGFRAWLSGVISAALYIAYYGYLESERGASFGKSILNLKVVNEQGGNPTMEQAIKRNAWLGLPVVPVIGGLAQLVAVIAIPITGSSDPYKRGWHDNFATTTTVVRTS